MEPDAAEIRVLGCLIEKQRTTPDQYPLSLNALRLACNQATNRNPVVDYDESIIRGALAHLARRGWTRLTSYHGSRAAKYRQLFDEALGLAQDDMAVLAVLMLRGPQTPGELKSRTERLHPFADLQAVHDTLERLIGRELVQRLDRRPGQKEERYVQLVGGDEEEATAPVTRATATAPAREAAATAPPAGEEAVAAPVTPPPPAEPEGPPSTPEEVTALLGDVADLRAEVTQMRAEMSAVRDAVATLRSELDALREELGA